VEILPVDEKIWLKNLQLDWPHRDPADRTIVATATLFSCPLITSDRVIQSFYAETIW
jgi:PIN domain nuclease of toxin-antitoxin system